MLPGGKKRLDLSEGLTDFKEVLISIYRVGTRKTKDLSGSIVNFTNIWLRACKTTKLSSNQPGLTEKQNINHFLVPSCNVKEALNI